MKITKTRLKEIIKEEVTKVLEEKSCKRDTDIEGVKVVEEEELEETSAMGGIREYYRDSSSERFCC